MEEEVAVGMVVCPRRPAVVGEVSLFSCGRHVRFAGFGPDETGQWDMSRIGQEGPPRRFGPAEYERFLMPGESRN